MWVFFVGKCVRTPQKAIAVDRKKQLCFFWHQDRSQILQTQAMCQPSSQQNTAVFAGKFPGNLNFSPSTKKKIEHCFELFLDIRYFSQD